MATIFDILNTINNNNIENCKRQCSINKTNKNSIDILPPMDVTMTNEQLIIETELAGISKDDIEINIKDSILTIQGEKKKSNNKQLVIEKSASSSSLSDNKEDEPSIEEFEDDVKPKSKSDNKTVVATTTTTTTSTATKENKEDENKTKSTNNKKFISERSFGNVKRYLDLTKVLYQLDLNSIKTQFENGLLTITINKKSDYSNTIKININ
ncbi:hypothetical protein ACTFIU_009721 [Dictyostelium citrinum]